MTYDPRNNSLAFALRSHPYVTPAAEASGIMQPVDQTFGYEPPDLGPSYDPTMGMIAGLTKRLTQLDRQPGAYDADTPGQVFQRPRVIVTAISNLTNQTINVTLGEGMGATSRTRLAMTIPVGTPPTSFEFPFNNALTVKQLYTTTGASAKATLTVGGTWAIGNVLSTMFTAIDISRATPQNPEVRVQIALNYTIVVGDINNSGSATSFAAAWNGNTTLASYALASAVGAVITLTAVQAGSLIQQSQLQSTATNASTFVTTPFQGAANPGASIAYYDLSV